AVTGRCGRPSRTRSALYADTVAMSAAAGTDRRSQLLAAARAVFGKKGYDSATVSEIVGRAGVAQGTFYLYFPGKDALAGAFAEEVAERFAALAEEKAARARTFETAVQRVLEAAYEVAEEYRDVFLIANRGVELVEDRDEWMTRTAPSREWLETFIITTAVAPSARIVFTRPR